MLKMSGYFFYFYFIYVVNNDVDKRYWFERK